MRLLPPAPLLAVLLAPLLAGWPPALSAAPPTLPPTMPGAVARLDLATRLYAHALAAGDPLAAVAAFRLAARVPLRADAAAPAVAAAPAPTGAAVPGAALSALALVTGGMEAATRDLAAGDDNLLELVDRASAETALGRIGVANGRSSRLQAGRQDVWELPLAGQEPAAIGLFPGAGGAFGWQITDAAGQTICAAAATPGPLTCAFTPAENAFFTVTVVARGAAAQAADYLLITD